MKAKRTFTSLFWPAFIELLFFMLMGTVDTLMLSNYSVFAVGAVGNAVTLVNMFAVLIMVISTGVAVLVAQHIGAKQEEEIRKTVGTGLFLNVFIGFVLGSLVFFLGKGLLRLVNTDIEIFNDSLTYLRLMGISLFFVALSHVMSGVIRSFGFAKYVTYIVMIGNGLNIIGNYLFINGNYGFPRLGVMGAGLTTLVIRGVMMICYGILLFKLIHLTKDDFKLRKTHLRNILKIGLPSALETWTYTIMQGIVISIINSLGPQYMTARTYVNTLLTYIYVFSLALATANAIMTGYFIGERNFDKAYQHTIKIVVRSFFIVTLMTLIVNVFSFEILSIFTSDEMIIEIARKVLWVAIFLEIGRSMNLIIIQSLRSAGDTKFPLIMAIISMLGIALPLAFLLGKWTTLGLFGIYIAFAVDELVRGTMMSLRWRSRKWESQSKYLEKKSYK